MNKELLEKYAHLKQVVAEAEVELDELKPQIVEMMGDNEEVQTDFGKFLLNKRRSWTYPEPLVEREKQLKVDQKLAQQLGTASYEEQKVLVYKQNNAQSTGEEA